MTELTREELKYDDLLPVCLFKTETNYLLMDRHNDLLATFCKERDDHECMRVVTAVNTFATLMKEHDELKEKLAAVERERDEARDELFALKDCLRMDHGYEFDGNIVNATAEFMWGLKRQLTEAQAKLKQEYNDGLEDACNEVVQYSRLDSERTEELCVAIRAIKWDMEGKP